MSDVEKTNRRIIWNIFNLSLKLSYGLHKSELLAKIVSIIKKDFKGKADKRDSWSCKNELLHIFFQIFIPESASIMTVVDKI